VHPQPLSLRLLKEALSRLRRLFNPTADKDKCNESARVSAHERLGEVLRRIEELDNGRVQGVPAEQVFARARKILGR